MNAQQQKDEQAGVHPNGWFKADTFNYDAGSLYGDYAVGNAFVSRYQKVESDWVAEIGYYVEPVDVHEDDPRHGTFGVQCCVEMWRDKGDSEQYDHERDYDYGDVLCYQTAEEAEAKAARLAQNDESYVFLA